MEFLLGIGTLVAFVVFRRLTARWRPANTIAAGRDLRGAATFYAIRSALSLVLLVMAFWALFVFAPTTLALFTPIRGWWGIIPTTIGVFGSLAVLAQVAQSNRMPEFVGLSRERKVLMVKGMFTLCRHPMYASWILALWGLLLTEPYLYTIMFAALLSMSFILEALEEEQTMARDFGDYYQRYRASTPFLLPRGALPFAARTTEASSQDVTTIRGKSPDKSKRAKKKYSAQR